MLACMPERGYVLGVLLPGLDQGITEHLGRLRCEPAVSDGQKHNVPEVFSLGQVSTGASEWYQFRHTPETACKLSHHEAWSCCASRGTQEPLHLHLSMHMPPQTTTGPPPNLSC
ncbi:hypothetical protein GOODEAATRI_007814 [Goodea atripinnis]|uniref:Uncharacterized protein n=1 Tax=Goodea atripinnis TaxID=208336 RepID=A0ABV0MZK6_9TELE